MLLAALALRATPTQAQACKGEVDRPLIPLVRVDPEYPIDAKRWGIEGWVELEFTVTRKGTVWDPRIIDSQPPAIFDEPALRAVQRWIYNPKINDGVAIPQSGVRVRLHFELDHPNLWGLEYRVL